MNRLPLAIVLAAIIIAVAIMIADRWHIVVWQAVIYRLDGWSGTVTVCSGELSRGEPYPCDRK